MDLSSAYASIVAEVHELLPDGAVVVDAHTHLGRDEDGQALDLAGLIACLDEVGPTARACTFALHDPDRAPAYRVPNDRVLEWAQESDGRVYPYCRLDPADDPVSEAERCLALGARGMKLHPRAQAFGFGDPAADSIWRVAQEAKVPILIHAGRGMPRMDPLADLALRFPDVVLVLAHAAIADQGMFASRLRDHPNVFYDTSTFSVFDQLELFARVPGRADRLCVRRSLRTAARCVAYRSADGALRRPRSGRAQAVGRWDDDRHSRPAAAGGAHLSKAPGHTADQRQASPHQRVSDDVLCRRDRLRPTAGLRPRDAVHRPRPRRLPRSRPRALSVRQWRGSTSCWPPPSRLSQPAMSGLAPRSAWSWLPARSRPPSRL